MSAINLFSVANVASLAFTAAMITAAVQLQTRASVVRSDPDALAREVVAGFQSNGQRPMSGCIETLRSLEFQLFELSRERGAKVNRHLAATRELHNWIVANTQHYETRIRHGSSGTRGHRADLEEGVPQAWDRGELMFRALFIFPFFTVAHVGTVFVALAIYRAWYVDAAAVEAFVARASTQVHLQAFTIEDFDTPVMYTAAYPLLHGVTNFFMLYKQERPGLWGLFKLWLCLLIQLDFLMIGSSIAALYIADAVTAGWFMFDLGAQVWFVVGYLFVFLILQDKVSQFWAFLTAAENPGRGIPLITLREARGML